jgi:hypothetical protein
MQEWGGALSEDRSSFGHGLAGGDHRAHVFDGLCSIIAGMTSATTVLIAQRNPQRGAIEVRGRYGTLVNEVDMTFALPQLDAAKAPTLAVMELRSDPRFASHPLLKLMPHAKSMIALLVPGCQNEQRAVLKIINPRRAIFSDAEVWRELSKFCEVIASVLCLKPGAAKHIDESTENIPTVGQIRLNKPSLKTEAQAFADFSGEQKLPCVAFLFDTLVKKRVLHARNGVDFITMRTWRGPMKEYQLAALVALKKNKPDELIKRVGSELAQAALGLHGAGNIGCVVPVPGGNSGDGHSFSVLVAHEVAACLKIPCEQVLVSPQQPAKPGASTPKKSARLKTFDVARSIKGPVLVVDDVVSSGKHMELAVAALRQQANAVYGIAWIGK